MRSGLLALGIDVGGSGIKAASVDCATGALLQERLRIETPTPATPETVLEVIKALVKHFSWKGPIGCGFPAVIVKGCIKTAANIDSSWLGVNGEELFSKATELPVRMVNDADAAGLAEFRFGAGLGQSGVTLLLTLGTGIGSALFHDGVLVPNTEFGHLEFKGAQAEKFVAASIRKKEDLSWSEYGGRLNEYLGHLDRVFSPDLILLGGGISKKFEKYSEYLVLNTKVMPARLENQAGIIGAAIHACEEKR